MTTELEGRAAFEAEAEIKTILKSMRTAWVYLAEKLYHFSDQKMFRDLGYETFEEWLATPDVDLSRRHVYALIEVWRETVIKRGLDADQLVNLEMTKVKEVLGAVRSGAVDLSVALGDAATLSRGDIRKRYRKGHYLVEGARWDDEDEPAYTQCPTCGSWVEAE